MSPGSSPLPLALGTVQLGLPYGVANQTGQPSFLEARAIIQRSWELGVALLDTAQAYGESETVIGRCLQETGLAGRIKIVTKLHPAESAKGPQAALRALEASWDRLGRARWHGLMLHREEELNRWDYWRSEVFKPFNNQFGADRFGVSVYSAEAALGALSCEGLTILQCPGNVFDRRIARSPLLEKARERRVSIHVRSIYLQGLALTAPEQLSEAMFFAAPAVRLFQTFCRDRGYDPRRFAIGYALRRFAGCTLVIGAETSAQAAWNAKAVKEGAIPENLANEWDCIWPDDDPALINPAQWPRSGAAK